MDDSPLIARGRLLLDRIRLGESSHLKLQVVHFAGTTLKGPDRKTLADELAAFANADGGVLVLGVDDKSRAIVGIPEDRVPEVVTLVRQVCADSIEPPLHAAIEPLRLPSPEGGDKPVVQVRVRRSLFVHRSPTGYLLRVGDEKRRMSTDYLARLFQQRSQSRLIRFDEQAVSEAGVDSLSEDLWRRFRTSRTGDARDGLLTKLRMARRDRDGVLRPSVAGVLMASRDPREWLPNAFIQAVAYRGADIRPAGRGRTYQLDAADITGPLDSPPGHPVARHRPPHADGPPRRRGPHHTRKQRASLGPRAPVPADRQRRAAADDLRAAGIARRPARSRPAPPRSPSPPHPRRYENGHTLK